MNFTVHAPSVVTPTVYREYFRAVQENVTWFGQLLWLDYTVLPSLPPTVTFTSVPEQLAPGATLEVAVDATDNRAVQRVDFTVGPHTVSATTPEPGNGRSFQARLPTADLTSGPQTVVARAVDRVGNVKVATATVHDRRAGPAASWIATVTARRARADCNDTNSVGRPRARTEVAGNGLDDDCAGGDAPGRITATVQNTWTAHANTTRGSRR